MNKINKSGLKAKTAASDSAAKKVNGLTSTAEENNSIANKKISTEEASGPKVKSKTKDPKTNGSVKEESNSMKKEEIKKMTRPIDKYFTKYNDVLNSSFKKFYVDATKSNLFDDPAIALILAERIYSLCAKNNNKIALTAAETLEEFRNQKLNDKQISFMLIWAARFLRGIVLADRTTFDDIADLFESHAFLYYKKIPKKKTIGSSLAELVKREIERLPKTLNEVKPEKRLDSLFRFLPYVEEETLSRSSELPNLNKLIKTLHHV